MKMLQKSTVLGPRMSVPWEQMSKAVEKIDDLAEHISVKLGVVVKKESEQEGAFWQ